MFVGLSGYRSASLPPYMNPDEIAHVGYAEVLANGRLPTIETPIPTDGKPLLHRQVAGQPDRRHTTWTANHPPGAYLLAAPAAFVLNAAGHGDAIAGVMRGLNVLGGVALLLCTFGLTRELTDGDISTSLFVTLLVALTPGLIMVVDQGLTDGIGTAAVVAAMWAAAVYFRRLDNQSAAWLGAVVAACSAVRLTSVALAVVIVVALLVIQLLEGRRPTWEQLLRIAAPTAVLTGWFWIRNLILYGDPSGSGVLLDRFGRTPLRRFGHIIENPRFAKQRLIELITGDTERGPYEFGDAFVYVVLAVMFVSIVFLASSLLFQPNRDGRGTTLRRQRKLLPVFVLIIPVNWVLLVHFASSGGSPHYRYLLPIIPVAALVIGLATALMPSTVRILVRGLLVAGLAALTYIRLSDIKWNSFFLVRDSEFPSLRQPIGSPSVQIAFLVLVATGVLLFGFTRSESARHAAVSRSSRTGDAGPQQR